MEVFIRDEDKKYAVVDKSQFEPYSFLLESYDKIKVKSIDQHDAEVRAEERKKVIDVFSELIIECFKKYSLNGKIIVFENVFENNITFLQQKLTELKGEKDE